MLNIYLNELKRKGKSELTVAAYKASIKRFNDWLLKQEGVHRGDGGAITQGQGAEIYTQNFYNRGLNEGPNETSTSTNVNPSNNNAIASLIASATELDVVNFKRWATEYYKPSTVTQTLSHVKGYFNFLVAHGQAPDNPVQHVNVVKTVKLAPKWLNRNEQNSLIRAIRKYGNPRELALVSLMLHTGLRVQEVADLRLVDVEIGERKGKVTVIKGKNNRRREVPLNVDVRHTLTRYLETDQPTEYLFPGRFGGKVTTRALRTPE